MSSSTEEFERYRLEVEALNGHHSQHVYDPVSKKSTWQVWMRKRPLGHGAFGEVQQEMWYDDSGDIHYRAVKICSEARMKSAQIDYKRELSALAAFSKSEYSGYFVNMHGWWLMSGNLYVAFEYLRYGDLSRYISNEIPEPEIKEIVSDVLRGLEVMHDAGFTHRDIKPQNLLVCQKQPEHRRWWVKIADFGISKQVLENAETALYTSVGTRPYCAPEILDLLPDRLTSVYTKKVDIWSLGCVLFNIASRGALPFTEGDLVRYCDKRVSYNPRNIPLHVSDEGQSFIESLLQATPEQRPTATEAIGDGWFAKSNTLPLKAKETLSSDIAPRRNFNSFLSSGPNSDLVQAITIPPTQFRTARLNDVRLDDTRSTVIQQVDHKDESSELKLNHVTSVQKEPASEPPTTVVPPTSASKLLQRNSHKTGLDVADQTPESREIQTALQEVHFDGAKWLQANKKDLERWREAGWPPLHLAASGGEIDAARWLVSQGADIEARNIYQQTPLHIASYHGQLEFAQCLVQAGANIETNNDEKWTPLHYAAFRGHLQVVQYLVQAGANIEANDNRNCTPLHYAALRGYLPIVQCLVQAGANIEANNNRNCTPLHYTALRGYLPIVQCLVQAGANIQANDDTKSTPLHYAALRGYLPIVQYLVQAGANIQANDDTKSTPLHYTADRGHLQVVQYLVQAGANIQANDEEKWTPLHYAAHRGHVQIVQWLTQRGADIKAVNTFGQTPEKLALGKGHKEVVKFFNGLKPYEVAKTSKVTKTSFVKRIFGRSTDQ